MKCFVSFLFFAFAMITVNAQSTITFLPTDSAKTQGIVQDSIHIHSTGQLVVHFENGKEQIIEICDRPLAFYQKTWFMLLSAAVIVFGLYLIFRFFLDRSRRSALAEARISQLERSALQAQMNPHFIFNSLNSIQSYIANNENDKANRFLAKFSRLIRAMLNHSRATKISLQEEIDSITLYLDLEKMRFKSKFDYEIVIDEDIDPSDIDLPPLLIQPYLENAIIHGLAQKRSQGKITLYYLLVGKYLEVTVTDNGIGIEKSKSQKGQTNSLHKSVGMTITQKRLEMLDEGNKDQKVDIKEVQDRHGEVLGTKVEVKIRVD